MNLTKYNKDRKFAGTKTISVTNQPSRSDITIYVQAMIVYLKQINLEAEKNHGKLSL